MIIFNLNEITHLHRIKISNRKICVRYKRIFVNCAVLKYISFESLCDTWNILIILVNVPIKTE